MGKCRQLSLRIAIMTLIGVLFLSMGCEDAPMETDEIAPDPSLPPAIVDLPPAPPAAAFVIPETNDDGTLRVEGVVVNQQKHLDKVIAIRGEVVGISKECSAKQAKKDGTECPQPYVVIQDDRDARTQMMVVGFNQELVKKAKLAVGEQRVFKGTYKKFAQGFVATEDGLLELEEIDGKEIGSL